MDIEGLLKKAKKWIKKPSNIFLILILFFALVIRLYYFSKTLGQPLWWDEAEYMTMAKAWAYNLEYTFISVRPVLFSLITAFFLKISYSEFLPRLMIMLFSFASVIGMYFLGKEFYNKKVGLLSSFLASVFWLDLFFSIRLLVDTPSMAFFIFSTLFFYKYIKSNSKKHLYIGTVIVALGVLFRLSVGIFLGCFLFYLIFTTGFKFLKRKELWIAGVLFILILSPYLIWGYVQFNGFVIKQARDWNAPDEFTFENLWYNMSSYFKNFPAYLSWPMLLVFLVGLASFYRVFVGFDMIIKGKGGRLKKQLFLILLFFIPLLFTSMSFSHHIENRYIMIAFPAIFIIVSQAIMKFYNSVNKQKALAVIAILFLLSYIAYFQLSSTNSSISNKMDSYEELKKAGLWIKENLPKDASVITISWPQIMYYSDRNTVKWNRDEEEFLQELQGIENPYLIVSILEPHDRWMMEFPQKSNLVPVYATFLDKQKKQPSLIVYNMTSYS